MQKRTGKAVQHAIVAPPKSSRLATLSWGCLVVGVLVYAYAPAIDGTPVWDDDRHLTSPALSSVAGLRHIWLVVGATQQYYPLTHSVFWLANRLWGHDPVGYHVLNLILHTCVALLFWRALRKLDTPGAGLAAFAFAVHPLQTESVAWISELKNVLSGTFYFLAAITYLRFVETTKTKTYGVALAFFVLALLSKTVTATLPVVLLVALWYKFGWSVAKRHVLHLVPFVVIGATAGLYTAYVEKVYIGAQGPEFALTIRDRMQVAGTVPWFYVSKWLWPASLNFLYPRWTLDNSLNAWALPALTLMVAAILFLWRRPERRAVVAALASFVVTLFPVLGFLNVYPFRFAFIADHFAYLACASLFALAAAALYRYVPNARVRMAVAVVLLSALTLSTHAQTARFQSAEALYRDSLARNSRSWLAHNNLAVLLLDRSSPDADTEALDHARRAVQLYPGYVQGHATLAAALQRAGDYDGAISHYRTVVAAIPDDWRAQLGLGQALNSRGFSEEALIHLQTADRLKPSSPDILVELAAASARTGRRELALDALERALAVDPESWRASANKGALLIELGDYQGALALLRRAASVQPQNYDVVLNLGVAYERLGAVDAALEAYRRAADLNPRSDEAPREAGRLLLDVGRVPEAVVEYQRALHRQPSSYESHQELGVAYASSGRLKEAAKEFRAALQAKPGDPAALANLRRLETMNRKPRR